MTCFFSCWIHLSARHRRTKKRANIFVMNINDRNFNFLVYRWNIIGNIIFRYIIFTLRPSLSSFQHFFRDFNQLTIENNEFIYILLNIGNIWSRKEILIASINLKFLDILSYKFFVKRSFCAMYLTKKICRLNFLTFFFFFFKYFSRYISIIIHAKIEYSINCKTCFPTSILISRR